MITVTANARNAVYTSDDLITSGSIGIPVKFALSADFDGLANIAVFQGSGVSIDVALTASLECVVPHEVVAIAGGYLRIGVYGRNGDGTIAIPTVWSEAKRILQGTVPSDVDPAAPTPDWTAQVQQLAADAYDMAENVQTKADAGEFDGAPGVSPTVAVTAITGGHRVTVTDADGTRSFDVLDGTDGDDGRGIASAVLNADYTLTLTYTDGTSYTTPSIRGVKGEDGVTFTPAVSAAGVISWTNDGELPNPEPVNIKGAPGDPGTPGISPTVTVTDITGGHRITITDAEGAHSFDVMDGDAADAPVQSVNGQTGAVVLDAADVGAGTYSKPSGGIPASDLAAGVIPTVPVQDVQVNGSSVLSGGVANVPIADSSNLGVVKAGSSTQIYANGSVEFRAVGASEVKAGTSYLRALTPERQHASVFYGLAKAAGSDMSSSSNAIGTYTNAAKSAIQTMLGLSAIIGKVEGETASKAYAVGDAFLHSGALYKATAAIASGAAIVPGTNCTQTTIIDLIKGA